VRAVRWMIEELRVSLFAQVLGTPGPVSEKRILAAVERLPAVGG
jgi:ATP-dependent helicase HrpA